MFNADPKVLARIAPNIVRAMVFDPQPAAAKLAAELLKELGAKHAVCVLRTTGGMEQIAHFDPQIIVTEAGGGEFDGVELVRRLRRSSLAARKAPVLMVTAGATVESIKAARDAGVHEVLRKPYTAKDMFRRVENVCLKPRTWIEAQMYVGPDRRRFNSGEFSGSRKRSADGEPAGEASSLPAADAA